MSGWLASLAGRKNSTDKGAKNLGELITTRMAWLTFHRTRDRNKMDKENALLIPVPLIIVALPAETSDSWKRRIIKNN